MNSAKSKVFVRLRIESDRYSCDQITEALGLSPSKHWGKGDYRPGTSITEAHHVWIFEQAFHGAESIESHVRQFLRALDRHHAQIARVANVGSGMLSVVVYATSTPALYFERAIIDDIAKLGLALDIDLYLAADE